MDKDLYRIMQEIYEKENQNAIKYKKFEVKDVQYMGTIETIEKINNVDTKIVKDIFKVIEKMKDGSIVENYYDDEINFIEGRNKDGQMYPSQNQMWKNINISEKIEDLQNAPTISLNEMNDLMEAIAKELGIRKEQILAMSQYDIDQPIENKNENNKKIKLDDDEEQKNDDKEEQEENKENQDEIQEQNEETLNNINAKQEIDADKKVDDVHTLGEILGLKPGSKLLAVYSDSIQDNEITTRFTAIEKQKDGKCKRVKSLKQIGGKNSNKKINEINRDGSKVEEESVQSSFAIESPLVPNGILTFRTGDAGYIEASCGQMDKTRPQEALTHELKTDRTKETTYKVREEFSYKKGTENIKEDLQELREAKEAGVEKMTLKDANGEKEDGVLDNIKNSNEEEIKNIVEKIKEENKDIRDTFTDIEIEHYLKKRSEEYGENESTKETIENTVENLKEEARHFRSKTIE